MWKIFNRLLGWDYVMIENNAHSQIKRIWFRADGVPMITAYPLQVWELKPPYHGWNVYPITAGAAEILREIEHIHKAG